MSGQGTLGGMVPLIIGMLICVGLAVAVVALVAIPARREGRGLLTPRGEEIIAVVKDKTVTTLETTGDPIVTAKDKVADTITPGPSTDEIGKHRAG